MPDKVGPGASSTIGVMHTSVVPEKDPRHFAATPPMTVSTAKLVSTSEVMKEEVLLASIKPAVML